MRSSPSHLATTIVVALLAAACSSTATPAPTMTPPPSEQPPSAPGTGTPGSTPIDTPGATPAEAAVWLGAGDLVEPRSAAHVVLLGAGKVLVVGSDWMTSWLATCGTATAGSDSVEIGDPLAKAWEKTTSLPSRREAPVVVALPDGRALLTGGRTGEEGGPTAYASTYLFDPEARSWSEFGPLNTARTGAASAVLADGRVLVAGGLSIDVAGQRDLDSSEVWDPASGTWSPTSPLAGTRLNASAVTLADGRVLVVGGVANNGDEIQLAAAEVFDPVSGRWSSAGTLATARSAFTLVALADGGAIVIGGFGGGAPRAVGRVSTVERFDPVSNSWSPAQDFPGPVTGATGIRLADGRVLVAGGSAREPKPIDPEAGTYVSGLAADAALFDPATGAWAVTTPMPTARAGASAVLLADGSALFAGGSAAEEPGTPGCPVAEPTVVRYVPGS